MGVLHILFVLRTKIMENKQDEIISQLSHSIDNCGPDRFKATALPVPIKYNQDGHAISSVCVGTEDRSDGGYMLDAVRVRE